MAVKSKKEEAPIHYISVRAFAKMLGVGHTAVVQAMDNGRITAGVYVHPGNGHRKIIPDVAREEFESTRDPKYINSRMNGKGRTDKQEKRGDGDSSSSKLVDVKLAKEKLNVKEQLIKLRKLEGELVDKELVYKALFEFGKMFRDTLMVIPDRITDQIVAAKSRNDVHNILTQELSDALRGLSDIKNLKFTKEK